MRGDFYSTCLSKLQQLAPVCHFGLWSFNNLSIHLAGLSAFNINAENDDEGLGEGSHGRNTHYGRFAQPVLLESR